MIKDMDTDEVKSLKRQRSILRVIVVVLAFVTLSSIMYAYEQREIAHENALLAIDNAKKAVRQAEIAKEALAESHRRVKSLNLLPHLYFFRKLT
jgi:hypothetical protein